MMNTRQLTIQIPEIILLIEKTDENTFAKELCLLAAVKLYEFGRLSSGRAAELAGRRIFADSLPLQGLSVSN